MIHSPHDFELNLELPFSDEALVHVFHRDRYLNSSTTPVTRPWKDWSMLGLEAVRVHSLGIWQGQKHFAVGLNDAFDLGSLPSGYRAAGLRSWFGVLNDIDLALAMRAVQILEWERTHRYCGACATLTVVSKGERGLRCPACNLLAYPRISPAMMVLVTRGRELLLARGVNFPPGRFSALAGFMEAGETIEQTIVREVREEVGVEVDHLEYFASQSWPFPNSLMIAFRARWVSGELRPDLAEIAEAGWYTPENLPEMPPRISIARALIESTIEKLKQS